MIGVEKVERADRDSCPNKFLDRGVQGPEEQGSEKDEEIQGQKKITTVFNF